MRATMRAFVICALLVVPTVANRAEACSCQAPGPPCETMFRSTVFVGTVTHVKTEPNGNTVTTFEVSEVLHAQKPLGKSVDVFHSAIGSICGTTFEQGKAYVVYASGDEQLSTGACTRTHLFKKGDEDVAFAHAKPPALASVSGFVNLTDHGALPGIVVRLKGTELTATSDKQGRFKLPVPPGEYELEVVTPGYRPWRGQPPKLSLPVAASCASPVLTLSIDGRIEGRLTDPKGQPVAGLEVYALAKREQDRHWRLSAKTDADGKYVIHEVPPGTFLVGVSVPDFDGVCPTSPYPTTWLPGVADVKAAKLVKLERAGQSTGHDFALPAALPISKVRGTVKRPDGTIPPGVYVTLAPVGGNRSTSGPADEKGGFAFDELSGLEVVIRACEFAPKQKCAEEKRTLSGDVTVPLVMPP